MNENRVIYPPPRVLSVLFDTVQRDALAAAESGMCGTLISAALTSLADCEYGPGGDQGATYRSASYAARLYGMDDLERQEWLKVVEHLGLTQRHIGHVISRAPFHETPAPSPPPTLHVGDRVRHRKYGVGEVVEVEPRLVRVSFGGDGESRTFAQGYLTRKIMDHVDEEAN